MAMIDTHCHIFDPVFDDDIEEVAIRSITNGVRGVLLLAESAKDIEKCVELKERFPDWINLGFGAHPMQKCGNNPSELRSIVTKDFEQMRELIYKHASKLVAIGEIGLDFTATLCNTDSCRTMQRGILINQVRMAHKLDLPLNVHSRSASISTLELLKSEDATRVQMHAFDGRPADAMIGVSAGFYFSIPPCVYRSVQKQELVKHIPLTSLLLETDSPLLGVTADERNEPVNVKQVCEYIAKAKGVDVDVVRQITTENAFKLYPKMVIKQF